jgi:hypothetical protein
MFLPMLLLAAQAATPSAAAGQDGSDTRCLLLFSVAGGDESASADMQQGGQIGAFFFLGRLLGRMPAADLEALMWREGQAFQKMSEAEAEAVGKSCDAELQAAARRLVEAANRVEAREQAAGR